MTARVGIDPEEEVKLIQTNLHSTVKIGTLKGTIKRDFGRGEGGVHAFECSVKERRAIVIIISQPLLTTFRTTFI